MSTIHQNFDPDIELAEQMKAYKERMANLHNAIKQDRINGEAALRRLLPIAQGNTGQCRRVAALLLSLYNGRRFPLDMTNLRSLDYGILHDCLAVIRMDANAYQEVHDYFPNGGEIFEKLAEDWGFNKKGGE